MKQIFKNIRKGVAFHLAAYICWHLHRLTNSLTERSAFGGFWALA